MNEIGEKINHRKMKNDERYATEAFKKLQKYCLFSSSFFLGGAGVAGKLYVKNQMGEKKATSLHSITITLNADLIQGGEIEKLRR